MELVFGEQTEQEIVFVPSVGMERHVMLSVLLQFACRKTSFSSASATRKANASVSTTERAATSACFATLALLDSGVRPAAKFATALATERAESTPDRVCAITPHRPATTAERAAKCARVASSEQIAAGATLDSISLHAAFTRLPFEIYHHRHHHLQLFLLSAHF
jgi:hypothetical protein